MVSGCFEHHLIEKWPMVSGCCFAHLIC